MYTNNVSSLEMARERAKDPYSDFSEFEARLKRRYASGEIDDSEYGSQLRELARRKKMQSLQNVNRERLGDIM